MLRMSAERSGQACSDSSSTRLPWFMASTRGSAAGTAAAGVAGAGAAPASSAMRAGSGATRASIRARTRPTGPAPRIAMSKADAVMSRF
ncbi:hypothetical protein G6F23_015171 [Rhizopus arrhizus]|nr:hypothetical protein G6F23_015171 [Rhizopus arrhizus]